MSAPLQATNVDNLSKATAGLYRVEIDTAPEKDTDNNAAPASGGWVEIRGLSKFAPKHEQQKEDDKTLGSGAYASEFPIGQAFTADVEGFAVLDESGTALDPGTFALLEAAKTYGFAGIGHFRYWRTDSLPEAGAFYATVGVSSSGDKPPALDKWSGTLTGRGAPVAITKPAGDITKVFTIGSGTTAYTVTVDGQTTTSISTLTASALQSALVALSTVGAGNVTVTGSSGGPLTAVFTVPVTVVTANGTGGTVTVS